MDMGALGRFEPSLMVVKIPPCASCGTANPQAAPHSPGCGAPAPPTAGSRQEISIAVNADHLIPWHAKALLAIGAWLKRLALRIKRE